MLHQASGAGRPPPMRAAAAAERSLGAAPARPVEGLLWQALGSRDVAHVLALRARRHFPAVAADDAAATEIVRAGLDASGASPPRGHRLRPTGNWTVGAAGSGAPSTD